MSTTIQAPTRAAVLELQNEQAVVNEAYTFLDEKRLLLASELLRQARLYQQLKEKLDVLQTKSKLAIQAALMFHGLDGLQVYPAASLKNASIEQTSRNFMGVTLLETELLTAELEPDQLAKSAARPVNSSKEADLCRQLFAEIVKHSAVLAGITGNLYRLLSEYRLTERRSRALENVILPEIKQSLREMSLHLEELDLEDAIRVHLRSGTRL